MKKYVLNTKTSFMVIDGVWNISNLSGQENHEITPPHEIMGQLLNVLRNRALAIPELISSLMPVEGYTKENVRLAIENMVDIKFLVEAADLSPCDPSPWRDYWLQREHIFHADYAAPGVFEEDEKMMRDYARDEIPSLYKHIPSSHTLKLAHPAYGIPSTMLNILGHVLFYGFGRLREATFLGFLPTMFKCVPSKGARHPFEAYIAVKSVEGIHDGLYHYNVKDHALDFIKEEPGEIEGLSLFVTAVYERYQWRYRNSWAYKDLFLELGHLAETLNYVCKRFNVDSKSMKACSMPFEEGLVEEILQVYKLRIL